MGMPSCWPKQEPPSSHAPGHLPAAQTPHSRGWRCGCEAWRMHLEAAGRCPPPRCMIWWKTGRTRAPGPAEVPEVRRLAGSTCMRHPRGRDLHPKEQFCCHALWLTHRAKQIFWTHAARYAQFLALGAPPGMTHLHVHANACTHTQVHTHIHI